MCFSLLSKMGCVFLYQTVFCVKVVSAATINFFWQLQLSCLDLLFQHMVVAFLAHYTPTPDLCGGSAFKNSSANWRLLFSPTQVQSKQNWEPGTRTLSLINFTAKVNVARDVYGEDNKNFWIGATFSLEKVNAVRSHFLYEETCKP